MCDDKLEVRGPSGEMLEFQRPRDDAMTILDVVIDRDPPVKQLNVGCAVLASVSSYDSDVMCQPATFVLATIKKKTHRPVMIEVEFDDNRSREWLTRDKIRTMVPPWPRRSRKSNPRRRPRKGEIDVLPHGVLRVSLVF